MIDGEYTEGGVKLAADSSVAYWGYYGICHGNPFEMRQILHRNVLSVYGIQKPGDRADKIQPFGFDFLVRCFRSAASPPGGDL